MIKLNKKVKTILKKIGINRELLRIPHYWIPYNFSGGRARKPLSVNIELTYRCNLVCQMCPQTRERDSMKDVPSNELTTDEVKRLIDELKHSGVKSVTFTGGEPLLKKDVSALVNYTKNKDINCTVLTNGAIITERIAEELVKAGLNHINFSIDGPKKIHDDIRGKEGTFSLASEGVRLIQKYKSKMGKSYPNIGFCCTISALNQGNFSQVLDLAHSLGVKDVTYGYMFYTSSEAVHMTEEKLKVGTTKKENQILPEYLKKVDADIILSEVKKCVEKSKRYSISLHFMPPLRNKKDVRERFIDVNKSYVNKCFHPWFASRVSPTGDVYPCSIDVRIGNVKDTSFDKLWNSDEYIKFRKLLRKAKLFPKCTKCCALYRKSWSYLPSFH